MGLPININDLIHGNTVEWERLEFKRNWNPEDVVHTMCAFANDIHNWGGGYIIIGIEEDNGQPVLPPSGLQQNQLDAIQGEIVNLANRVHPSFFPITKPYVLQEKHILVLWCPAGDNRPYTAPSTLGANAQRHHYIRVGSRSVIARGDQLRQLQELAARIPFDDRINNQASIQDLDLGLIQAFLQEVKSDLYKESTSMSMEDLCKTMLIAKGPDEDLRPVNVGLMFFSKTPEQFFNRARIELVWHKNGSGQEYQEVYFEGPLHAQLRDALSFLKSNIIREQVIKSSDKAEANRFFNFPYDAVEEALSNAVYHKSYELGSPIEVQVWQDKIEILSHPGPVPPVNANILSTHKRIVAREYRNRRIGDFLKELHLTEGRGTGFPTIYNSMNDNGSPDPVFDTDDQSYFLVTLPAHALTSDHEGNQVANQDGELTFNTLEDIIAATNQATNQVTNQATEHINAIISDDVHDRVAEMLEMLMEKMKRSEIFGKMDLSNQTFNRVKYLDPLIEAGWVKMEFPEEKTSPNQRYMTTESGKNLLNLIKAE